MTIFVVSTSGETAIVPLEDLPPLARAAHENALGRWSKRVFSEWAAVVASAMA